MIEGRNAVSYGRRNDSGNAVNLIGAAHANDKGVFHTEVSDKSHTHDCLQGADVPDGGAGNDQLVGGGGSDISIGGDSADTLQGDDIESRVAAVAHGDDFIDGGADNDAVWSMGGADVISADARNDDLWGDGSQVRGGIEYANFAPQQYHGATQRAFSPRSTHGHHGVAQCGRASLNRADAKAHCAHASQAMAICEAKIRLHEMRYRGLGQGLRGLQ